MAETPSMSLCHPDRNLQPAIASAAGSLVAESAPFQLTDLSRK